MTDGISPSQTVGPFFAFALTPTRYSYVALAGNDLRTEDAVGEAITIEGRVIDGAGQPVPDAMVEIWQADGLGRYATRERANTRFIGFGRCETSDGALFRFMTVKPGRVPGPEGRLQAPHINVGVFARGILKRLFTRLYFSDEPANADDPILELAPASRRSPLIAQRQDAPGRDAIPRYVFDIRLQGDKETVFFEA